MSLITIHYQGSGWYILKEIADEMGVENNETVSEDLFWDVLTRNDAHIIEQCMIHFNEQTPTLPK